MEKLNYSCFRKLSGQSSIAIKNTSFRHYMEQRWKQNSIESFLKTIRTFRYINPLINIFISSLLKHPSFSAVFSFKTNLLSFLDITLSPRNGKAFRDIKNPLAITCSVKVVLLNEIYMCTEFHMNTCKYVWAIHQGFWLCSRGRRRAPVLRPGPSLCSGLMTSDSNACANFWVWVFKYVKWTNEWT